MTRRDIIKEINEAVMAYEKSKEKNGGSDGTTESFKLKTEVDTLKRLGEKYFT